MHSACPIDLDRNAGGRRPATQGLDDHGGAGEEQLAQPFGIMHGGVYSGLVEGLCSLATAVAVWEEGRICVGQSINVSFLRPVSERHAEARARARHRGRTTWIWTADVLDAEERLCATATMTMAVRPRPDGG